MNNNKKTLNDILDDYKLIEAKIIDNEGALDESVENLLNLNESDLKDKLDGYENFIRYLYGQVSYLKDMENHFNKRRVILEKSTKKYKDSMVRALSMTGNNKIKTNNFNFSLCKSETWGIDTELLDENIKNDLIEDGLAESVFTPSIIKIRNAFKNKKDKPEWLIVGENEYIRVS